MSQYLRNVDLNLLSIFIAMMHEQNLSHAAENLGMSQPAVSQALKRLRSIYNDPLFERKSGKMMPTLKAEAIAPIIEEMLSNVSMTLPDSTTFDPKTTRSNFKINIAGIENSFMLTNLASAVAKLAPNASLTISNDVLSAPEKALRLKEYDLHLDYLALQTDDCYSKVLFTDEIYILASKKHPRLGEAKTITKEAFLNEKHAVLTPRDNNVYPVQLSLKALALDRDIKYTTTSFENIIEIIKVTDYVCIMPGIILNSVANIDEFVWFEPPFEVQKSRAFMNWHWSMEHLKSHRWIRKILIDTCSSYQPKELIK